MSLASDISVKVWNDFIARPYNQGKEYQFSFANLEKEVGKIVNAEMKSMFEEILFQKREIIGGALRNEVVDVSVILNKAESLGIIFEPKF